MHSEDESADRGAGVADGRPASSPVAGESLEPASWAPEAARCALLVVDMQRDFCEDGYAFSRLGLSIDRNREVVPALAAFVGRARERGVTIVWIRHEVTPDVISPARRRWAARRNRKPTTVCAKGTPGAELATGLTPRGSDLTVSKYRYSAFIDTTLAAQLEKRGIEALIVTGTEANVCVDTTSRDGFQRDFDVFVLRDLVGHTDAGLAEAALRNLELNFATVCDSEELLRSLS